MKNPRFRLKWSCVLSLGSSCLSLTIVCSWAANAFPTPCSVWGRASRIFCTDKRGISIYHARFENGFRALTVIRSRLKIHFFSNMACNLVNIFNKGSSLKGRLTAWLRTSIWPSKRSSPTLCMRKSFLAFSMQLSARAPATKQFLK